MFCHCSFFQAISIWCLRPRRVFCSYTMSSNVISSRRSKRTKRRCGSWLCTRAHRFRNPRASLWLRAHLLTSRSSFGTSSRTKTPVSSTWHSTRKSSQLMKWWAWSSLQTASTSCSHYWIRPWRCAILIPWNCPSTSMVMLYQFSASTFLPTIPSWCLAQPIRTLRFGASTSEISTSPSSPTRTRSPPFSLSKRPIMWCRAQKIKPWNSLIVTHMMKYSSSTTSSEKFGLWQFRALATSS